MRAHAAVAIAVFLMSPSLAVPVPATSFTITTSITLQAPTDSLAIVDLSADGKADVAVSPGPAASANPDGIHILSLDATGNLVELTTTSPRYLFPATSGQWQTIRAGDVNGDGIVDLVGCSAGSAGRGVAAFYDWPGDPVAGIPADFMGDASPSRVVITPPAAPGVCASGTALVTVTDSFGTASFRAVAPVTDTTGTAVTSGKSGTTIVIHGSTTGPSNFGPGCRVFFVKVSPPLVIEGQVISSIDGSIVVEVPNVFGSPSTPDLAGLSIYVQPVANVAATIPSYTFDILETDAATPAVPVITAVTPESQCASQTITIHGVNFDGYVGCGTPPCASHADFDSGGGPVAMTILSWTETTITAVVPPAASSGIVRVTSGLTSLASAPFYVSVPAPGSPATPTISCVAPDLLQLGAPLGTFGDERGSVTLDKGWGPVDAAVESWSDIGVLCHIPVLVGPSFNVSPGSIPCATQSVPFSHTFSATGGTPPYDVVVSRGQLPGGLTLDRRTGFLSGTTSAGGFQQFSIAITDANGETATRDYSMFVNFPGCGSSLSFTTGGADPEELEPASVGASYVESITPVGPSIWSWGPPSWNPGPPAGLTLNTPNNAPATLNGTPSTGGFTDLTIAINDGAGCTTSVTYRLRIEPVPMQVVAKGVGRCPTNPTTVTPLVSCGTMGPYIGAVSSTCPDGANAVVITGSHFGTGGSVWFNAGSGCPPTGTLGTVLSWSEQQVVVVPPATVSTGPVALQRIEGSLCSNVVLFTVQSNIDGSAPPYGIEGAGGPAPPDPISFFGGPWGATSGLVTWNGAPGVSSIVSWGPSQVDAYPPAGARDWPYLDAAPVQLDWYGTRGIVAGADTVAPRPPFSAMQGIQVYSVGGDGTIHEVAQGATGCLALPTTGAHRLADGDVDGNGADDVLDMPTTGGMQLYLNNGYGQFCQSGPSGLPSGGVYANGRILDLNLDFFPDVVALDQASGQIVTFFGNGTATFDFVCPLALDATFAPASSFTVADLDNDGLLDLAVGVVAGSGSYVKVATGSLETGSCSANVSPYYSFLPDVAVALPAPPLSVEAASMSSDDQSDLVVSAGNAVYLLVNGPEVTHLSSASPGSETIEVGLAP